MYDVSAYINLVVEEQSNYGNDIEQFGQLLATLLGHCHDSSEYIKVNKVQYVSFRKESFLPPRSCKSANCKYFR